jgi:hypothetical protein
VWLPGVFLSSLLLLTFSRATRSRCQRKSVAGATGKTTGHGWRLTSRDKPPAHAVGVVPPQSATELAAQHLTLMAQDEQLGALGQVRPDQPRQQAQQAPHQAVGERQQHLAIVPATPLIPQQNPSSQRKAGFPNVPRCGPETVADIEQVRHGGSSRCAATSF